MNRFDPSRIIFGAAISFEIPGSFIYLQPPTAYPLLASPRNTRKLRSFHSPMLPGFQQLHPLGGNMLIWALSGICWWLPGMKGGSTPTRPYHCKHSGADIRF